MIRPKTILKWASALLAAMSLATPAIAADPVNNWCQGVTIAAFPGGPQGGVFANNVYNGFKQAEQDLGPEVRYYFSNWDPNLMLSQIQQAVASNVDGIATYGFAGEDATGPVVKEAYSRGIVFTTLNTALPQSQEQFAPQGFGFVGAPNYN
ncbi:MAG: substrate-binding domain-containing protein, partial [bacterium]